MRILCPIPTLGLAWLINEATTQIFCHGHLSPELLEQNPSGPSPISALSSFLFLFFFYPVPFLSPTKAPARKSGEAPYAFPVGCGADVHFGKFWDIPDLIEASGSKLESKLCPNVCKGMMLSTMDVILCCK